MIPCDFDRRLGQLRFRRQFGAISHRSGGIPPFSFHLSLWSHATRSHFPLPPVQNVENVDEIMLRFEGREKEQALAETRLYRGEGSPMPHSESERDRALPPVAAG